MGRPMKPYVQAGRLIRFLAWLQLVALIGIATAIIVPIVTSGKGMIAQVSLFEALAIALVLGIAKLFFVLGTAVKEHKEWARKVGIGLGILLLFGFPIGTIVGAYILWALIKGWQE
jgi:hypothetical protein